MSEGAPEVPRGSGTELQEGGMPWRTGEESSPRGLARSWFIIDGNAHPLFSEGPYRSFKWMLLRFVGTANDTCKIGFGGQGTNGFTLLANEPPIVLRDFDPREMEMTYQSGGSASDHLDCLGV